MIRNIIGALAGKKLASTTTSIGGPAGAALGVVSMAVLRRASIPAMLAIAAGGYAFKKYSEKREAEVSGTTATGKTPPKVKQPKV